MKYTFAKELLPIAKKNPRIMLLTADLGFTVFEEFKQTLPKQFIDVGVAEQNLMGFAAGMALTGYTVFAYSIPTFATMRPFEQVRNDIAAHKASVIIVGTGAGLSYSEAQLTHHSLEDVALMRTIPGMTILCPSDLVELRWSIKTAIALRRPVYLRIGKKDEAHIHEKPVNFRLGKAAVLKKGKHIAVMTYGPIAREVCEAGKILALKKQQITIVSMLTIKPIDRDMIRKIASTHAYIVTVEEHSIIGGLGSAVSEIIAEDKLPSRILRIGVEDKFVHDVGTHEYLRHVLKLDAQGIVERIEQKTV